MNASRYNLIFYEEEKLFRFITALTSSKGKNISAVKYAYIPHDSDIDFETGQSKKLHFHLWLEFPTQVKSRDLENLLQVSGSPISALSYDKTDRNFLAYLTHDTINSKLKAHYNKKDIITNMEESEFDYIYNLAIEKTNKPSKSELNGLKIADLTRIIEENPNIICVGSLVHFLLLNEQYDLLDYVSKKTYFLNLAFKREFEANSIKLSSGELESIVKDRLDYAKNEYKELQKLNSKVCEQIDTIEMLEIDKIRGAKNE